MSGYSKMQAPPFWRWMFRIAGILSLVTLILPSLYYFKYAVADGPRQQNLARSLPLSPAVAGQPIAVGRVDYYARCARAGQDAQTRLAGIQALGRLLALPGAQWKHPIECLRAKLALSAAATHETDPDVRQVAQGAMRTVEANGAVITR